MLITRQTIAETLEAYLRHELSLKDLVSWAECSLLDGEIDAQDGVIIREAIARLGVADVRAFGLTWEDCEHLLTQLGYSAHIQIVAT
ncbi:MAG: hypothetical protein ACPGYT_08150 [Nitrospirales bacterium]